MCMLTCVTSMRTQQRERGAAIKNVTCSQTLQSHTNREDDEDTITVVRKMVSRRREGECVAGH